MPSKAVAREARCVALRTAFACAPERQQGEKLKVAPDKSPSPNWLGDSRLGDSRQSADPRRMLADPVTGILCAAIPTWAVRWRNFRYGTQMSRRKSELASFFRSQQGGFTKLKPSDRAI
jgi:hypothetical protein